MARDSAFAGAVKGHQPFLIEACARGSRICESAAMRREFAGSWASSYGLPQSSRYAVRLCSGYRDALDAYRDIVADFTEVEQAQPLHANAERIFRI